MGASKAPQWRDLWALYCPDYNRDELDKCAWLLESPLRWPLEENTPVEFCDWLARLYCVYATEAHRKAHGQFFTPPAIARFMARLSAPLAAGAWVLEPGAGTGILLAGLAEHFIKQEGFSAWRVTAYETEATLRPALTLALGYARHWLSMRDVSFKFEIQTSDFILANTSLLRPAPLLESLDEQHSPQLIISNPPYFKLPKSDPRVSVLKEVVHGQPNIYALFMAASAKLLHPEGQLIFITPRSFCSGPYFRQFRKWFFQAIALERVHLFESRTEAFGCDEVLQENVILSGVKTTTQRETVEISSSYGAADLERAAIKRVPLRDILDLNSPEAMLSLPIGPADASIREIFPRWPGRLRTLGLEISTGPIVPFRTDALTNEGGAAGTAPVIWVQHVGRMAITWPLLRFAKPQWIRIEPSTRRLLLPNANYVLVRRFSPKEDNSRMIAAPHLRDELPSEFLGVENHVNYIHKPGSILSRPEALGLAAFLNSRWVENYFRMSSGNTQVSATELRSLPLPPLEKIRCIGERLQEDGASKVALVNEVVGEELGLPMDLPSGNGGHMPKKRRSQYNGDKFIGPRQPASRKGKQKRSPR